MVPGYIIIIVIVVILYYAASNENSQIAATASAIRQIWSGGCGPSCRPSQASGLSGLPEAPCQGTSQQGCACDTCPCAMIEDVLRTCSPATRMYTNATDALSNYYYQLLKGIMEAFEYAARVMECGASCQRQAQIVGPKEFNSSENFKYNETNQEKPGGTSKLPKCVKSAIDLSKTMLTSKKSAISFKKPLEDDSDSGSKTSEESQDKSQDKSQAKSKTKSRSKSKRKGKGKNQGSDDTLKPDDSGSVLKGFCSKCIEEGKTCISECPRAKKVKKN